MSPPKITVRGAGRSKGIPKGYILGRTSHGTGNVELLNLAELRKAGIASTSSVSTVAGTHGFGFFAGGLLLSNELLGSCTFPLDIVFTSPDAGSVVTSEFPASATAVLNVLAPDPSSGLDVVVGTFTFAAASKVAVVAWGAGTYTLKAGKVLKLRAPTPADAGLASVHGTISGVE